MTNYVCGFMFSEDKVALLMIEKSHPEWQKGLLNGVGGTIQEGETPLQAMVREFKEEVGLQTQESQWIPYYVKGDEEVTIHFFKAFSNEVYNATQIEMEVPKIIGAADIALYKNQTVEDVDFLVTKALTI